jgi:hypothetical protein
MTAQFEKHSVSRGLQMQSYSSNTYRDKVVGSNFLYDLVVKNYMLYK